MTIVEENKAVPEEAAAIAAITSNQEHVSDGMQPPEITVNSNAKVRNDPEGSHVEEMELVKPANKPVEVSRDKPPLLSKVSSVLPASDDPFAPREGKTLLWRNVNMILVSKIWTDDRLETPLVQSNQSAQTCSLFRKQKTTNPIASC